MYILINTESNEVLTDTPLIDERCGLPPNIRKIKADKLPKIPQGKALIFEQKTNTIKEVADLRNAEYTLKDETTTTVDKLFFKLPEGATFDKKPSENHKLKNGEWVNKYSDVELQKMSFDKTIKQYEQAVQNYLDDTAKGKRYEDILSAVSYAVHSDSGKFYQEGRKFLKWRSDVWQYMIDELAKVKAKTRTMPTIDAIILELPKFEN